MTLFRRALALSLVVCSVLAGAWARPARAGVGYVEVRDGTAGKLAGVDLSAVGPRGPGGLAASVQRLRTDGLNSVTLDVWWEADSARADALHPYSDTTSDSELSAEIKVARAAGLSVTLTPLFYCSGCQGGFRGVIEPADRTAFFRSYTGFIDHYAGLAQADGVDTFYVGSELSSIEAETARWNAVIAGVRRVYRGRLAYEENWDVLGNARFLASMDLIGVSAYFPLDGAASPTLAQLLADWRSSAMPGWQGRNWVNQVAALAQRYHRPITFGEAGYMSGDYAAARPYLDYYSVPNPALQADLYQALLETFEPYGWWAGVSWWDWDVLPDGPAANGRTFQGKNAEVMLQCWYARGMRPTDPANPLP